MGKTKSVGLGKSSMDTGAGDAAYIAANVMDCFARPVPANLTPEQEANLERYYASCAHLLGTLDNLP